MHCGLSKLDSASVKDRSVRVIPHKGPSLLLTNGLVGRREGPSVLSLHLDHKVNAHAHARELVKWLDWLSGGSHVQVAQRQGVPQG